MTPKKKSIKVVRKTRELRQQVARWRGRRETIALVPTMGALHEGHLKLVAEARKKAKRTIVSIFVNPRQFAPHEDFDRYPRDEEADLAKLAKAGVDLVWSPAAAEMYPAGFATRIEVEGAARELETDFRPHFFGGVATVCCKLFSQVAPDVALFGEKDYQQLCVIRQMVRDLDLPLTIKGVATVREKDGLALSSRNAYLSEEERKIAPALYAALGKLAADVNAGGSITMLQAEASMGLLAAGFSKVDYVEVREAETLAPYDPAAKRKGRVLAAAWLGRTRLIDNRAL
ncbi:MAG: pantoate--beta-alanine ligase [Pseudomonadota bacterium]